MSFPNSLTFNVSIPTENGFLGRECNNPECKKYFKIHTDAMKDEMYCPYCGNIFKKEELWSTDQIEYARKLAQEEAMALVHKELGDMLKNAFSGSEFITVTPSSPYRKKTTTPPKGKEVDSELSCPGCKSSFQVFGIFGFCPVCRSENLLLYDANWEIIKKEIESSDNKERVLRHAYSDLVSTFESFCRKKAEKLALEKGRFQNLDHTRKQFRVAAGVDIYSELKTDEIRQIKRVFEKRNVSEHNQGIISKRYVEQIPEDRDMLGKKVELSIVELDFAADVLRRMLDKLG